MFAMTVPDATPPETVATVTGTAGNDGWFKAGDPVVVTLTATDEGSGVASTTVSIDGGPEEPYTAPITLTDGMHTLTFFSTDEAGNVEPAQSLTVRVDQTPPAIEATPRRRRTRTAGTTVTWASRSRAPTPRRVSSRATATRSSSKRATGQKP